MSTQAVAARVPAPGELFAMRCRSCGGRRIEHFLDLSPQPHCNRLVRPDLQSGLEPRFPLRAGFCHDCTLVQIDHTIPKAQMFSEYPYVSGTTVTLVEHFRRSAERLTARLGLGPGDLVVDIGSNDGSWLRQYRGDVAILGVEPAGNVAAIAAAAGVPTLNRFFDEEVAAAILAEHGPARLVTAAGVFFHLEDLHSVVRGVGRLISDDGTFVVQAIYLGEMVRKRAFDQIYHEHLCFYTLRSLQALLAPNGLEVVDVELLPIHGGSLEATVRRTGRARASARLTEWQAAEAAAGLGKIDVYREFASAVVAQGLRLRALLEDYRMRGRTVWAFGAPAKGATLLNAFGIGPALVPCATEKNPMKIGLAIPGCRIPIRAESPDQRPDAYLMLAWNFLDEFLARERQYLEDGGEFIVPVPRLEIIGKDGARPA